MKRALSIASVALVAAFVAGAMFLPATLPPEVIERSVVREQTMLEKAWHLPVASAFDRHVDFQSNQSLCGPASIANILRSFGEAADTEKKVLAHTTKCWSGICFFGLSLDELADVTRTATKRSVTVLRDLTPEAFRDDWGTSTTPAADMSSTSHAHQFLVPVSATTRPSPATLRPRTWCWFST